MPLSLGGLKGKAMTQKNPIGIRLNNPTNIRSVKGQTWIGQAANQPDENFVKFVDAKYGYRASNHIIMRGWLSGRQSIKDVISHWAPPNENDTEAYEQAISQRINWPVGTALELPAQMPQLLHAITIQEQGFFPYTDQTIQDGITLDGGGDVKKQPQRSKTVATTVGAVKSKTMWVGAALAVASNVQAMWPQAAEQFHCSPTAVQLGGSLIATVILVLRMMTTQSLMEKGLNTGDDK
jgi:hypothetical protein